VITWGQLGIHSKPIGLLYYDPLLKLIENAVDEGFIGSELAKKILVVSSEPSELLDLLEQHKPPVPTIKWLSEDQI
jgi:predicted Rossmann-fold nucleotide-binding protein